VFTPENVSSSQNEVHSDTVNDTDAPPIGSFNISNLDSSTDEPMDETEPW